METFCSKCGAYLVPSHSSCVRCGNKFGGEELSSENNMATGSTMASADILRCPFRFKRVLIYIALTILVLVIGRGILQRDKVIGERAAQRRYAYSAIQCVLRRDVDREIAQWKSYGWDLISKSPDRLPWADPFTGQRQTGGDVVILEFKAPAGTPNPPPYLPSHAKN